MPFTDRAIPHRPRLDREMASQTLQELAFRVRCLRLDHRDPERFHIEKSEIEHELRILARQTATR